ncbi:MAG: ribonuclease P protein component [Planctomycetia bacterium]|nr:ribonuclease P protein component [Planctomycetia bacterium]
MTSERIAPQVRPDDQRLRKSNRLRRQADFARTYATGQRAWNRGVTICACSAGLPESRIGLSISKRVGSSPVRNRWKRLLREVFRRHKATLPTGCDFIVIVRPGTPLMTLAELDRIVPDLMTRAVRKCDRPSRRVRPENREPGTKIK